MRTAANGATPAAIIASAATIQEASSAMLDEDVEVAVVVDGKKVRGVLTAADVAGALADGRDVATTPASAVAHRDAPLIDAHALLAEVHQQMRAAGQDLAVVISDSRPVGVLIDDTAA